MGDTPTPGGTDMTDPAPTPEAAKVDAVAAQAAIDAETARADELQAKLDALEAKSEADKQAAIDAAAVKAKADADAATVAAATVTFRSTYGLHLFDLDVAFQYDAEATGSASERVYSLTTADTKQVGALRRLLKAGELGEYSVYELKG